MGGGVMEHEVTVVIPTIAPRQNRHILLAEALESIEQQSHPATAIIVENAGPTEGPAIVRNRAVEKVRTEWIAFLDDDDKFLWSHLEVLCAAQEATGADLVYPWFGMIGGADPFPMFFGRQWNPEDPHQIPITFLLRTEAFRAVGGFEVVPEGEVHADGNRAGEDWRLTLALSAAGYKFHHVAERTWLWRHWGSNTSGLPERI